VEGAWGDISATCFAMAYIGIPFAAMTTLFLAGPQGRAWLLLMMAVIWTCDSMALFVGRSLGTRKMWPKLSPGKTWEGTIGGIAGGLIPVAVAGLFFGQWFPNVSVAEFIAFGLLFAVVGTLGDLAESLLKRDVGVKDSGSEVTGHGGFLDMMDAVLFSALPLLAYVKFFHPYVLTGA
jgi:phosphatidate cytidylyltransferase